MTEERYDNLENKVLPIDNFLKAKEDANEISQLLIHMRQVRQAVPVNRRLQVELRKKLLERQRELMNQGPAGNSLPEVSKAKNHLMYRWRPRLPVIVGALAVIMVVFFLGYGQFAKGQDHLAVVGTPQELTRFWTEDVPLQPAISPDGSKIVVVRGGGLVLLSNTGTQLASLEPPAGATFRSPAWSPNGNQVSFVLSHQGSEEIKQIAAEELTASGKINRANSEPQTLGQRTMASQDSIALNETKADDQQKDIHYSNLVYSPDGQNLAYVVNKLGEPTEIWVRSSDGQEKKITNGDAPTWSPNGKFLVVQRPGRAKIYDLWLVNVASGDAEILGPGENPVWGKSGYLAFCTEAIQERVLTFQPNGEPQYKVRQQMAEMRSTYLGKDGSHMLKKLTAGEGWLTNSHLLVAPENRISGIEINWLRQQEMSGSFEPKTLVLNEIFKCEGQVFGPEDQWLLFARRDGDTVALLKLNVEKK
ncbi:peptidase S9 [Desulfotomaculum sp. 1211_IL3151]|uniref:peptidase S9 n=1 Tax=Desulfotomaculum sp. 1211_IL3151 TaxID=3084055 RepID=UPI002FDB53FE